MHRRRRFTRALTVAIAVFLVAAVTAPAQPGLNPRPRQDLRSPDARDVADGRPAPWEIVTLVRLVPDRRAAEPEPSGFHLRDAGIGAAAATGLILLVAGTVTTRRRRRDRPFSIVIQRSL